MILRAHAVVLAGLLAACGVPPLVVRELDSPSPVGSGLPHLAARSDGSVLLSWVEGAGGERHRLRFAAWMRGWSAPSTVSEGKRWFVNWADFPTIAALGERGLAAHWLEKTGEGRYAYEVRVALSDDGGASFGAPFVAHADRSETEHGFVSLVALGGGRLGAAWLDGRLMAGGAHEGPMTLRAGVFGAGGETLEEDLVDERVCDCCQTSGVVLDDGTWLVAYRDRSDDEVRDVAVARRVSGKWEPGHPVHGDGWRIPGCPVNGPAIAASGLDVAVAWYTEAASPAVLVALSRDGGRSFALPIRVDEGRPLGRVAVAFAGPRMIVTAWLEREPAGDAATVRARGLSLGGRPGPTAAVGRTSATRAAGFPRLAPSPAGVVAAWTDAAAETPRVRAALLAPPHGP